MKDNSFMFMVYLGAGLPDLKFNPTKDDWKIAYTPEASRPGIRPSIMMKIK